MQKSLFQYYGGKAYLISDIWNVIYSANKDKKITCVVDVFGGSGKVLLNKPPEWKVNAVYNDIDKRLYYTFKVLQDDSKRQMLIDKWDLAFKHRLIFEEFKEVEEPEETTDIEIAFNLLYLVQNSYSGNTSNYRISIKDYRDPLSEAKNNIIHNSKYLKLWNIEYLDFEELIKKYDSLTTFFYLDPPYIKAGKTYKFSFSENDWLRLKTCMDNMQGRYLLNESERDFKYIKELFGEPKMVREYVNHVTHNRASFASGNGPSHRLEGFWYNF